MEGKRKKVGRRYAAREAREQLEFFSSSPPQPLGSTLQSPGAALASICKKKRNMDNFSSFDPAAAVAARHEALLMAAASDSESSSSSSERGRGGGESSSSPSGDEKGDDEDRGRKTKTASTSEEQRGRSEGARMGPL